MQKILCPKCQRLVPARTDPRIRAVVPAPHICVNPAAYETPAPMEERGLTREMPVTERKG